jgi:16S rRNA (cytosine1402-N4)-methyltransferase
MDLNYTHVPVLLNEAITGLDIKPDGIYVDCTLGRGGHSSKILSLLSNLGHLYAFDQDKVAIETSNLRLATISPHYTLIHANFRELKASLKDLNVELVDGILFDLGVSSPMFDELERGFSYRLDAPLDMRMDQSQTLTAQKLVNELSESELTEIFFEYGEEKFSRKIAQKICQVRQQKPIVTTLELVDIIKSVIPPSLRQDHHPAKRVFQALRIAVNEELDVLESALYQALDILKSGGRLCVISFHSLEDRIVKNVFKEVSEPKPWNRNMPLTNEQEEIKFRLITKKPIVASSEELAINNRAHSAKLRIIERI